MYTLFLEIMTILAGLLTPLIGAIAIYIAWQQWRTSHHKLTLDLYDRRLRIYMEVVRVLSIIVREADISYETLAIFRGSVAEADFIFGQEIVSFIDEIYCRGVQLHGFNEAQRNSREHYSPDYDSKATLDGKNEELMWLVSQLENVKDKFGKYMNIRSRAF